jgi:site-specific DNA-methyltransferase (adenine-specific)
MSEGKKEILLGDCLELMKDIPKGSIDMILCDLPYGTTACKWDTIIPFDKLWEHYERIIKPNGAIVLTASQPFTSALVMSNPKMFRYEWIWEKTMATGGLMAKYRPMKAHESILIFNTSKGSTYNEQRLDGEAYKRVEGKKKDSVIGDKSGGYVTISDGGRAARSVVKISNPNSGSLHPTQKPIALFEYLIKTYTNENDLVLDNTAGSGTTAISCLNTNRQFIVMEKEQKYYDIILKRVGDFNKKFEQQTLFGNEI